MHTYNILIIATDSRGRNVFPKELSRYIEEWNLVLNDELETFNVIIKSSEAIYEAQTFTQNTHISNCYRGTNAWYPSDVVIHNILSTLEGFNIDRRNKLEKKGLVLNRVYISRIGDMSVRQIAELQSRIAYLLNGDINNIVFDW